MVKRARVTAETYEKKPNAIDKLVGNLPQEDTEQEELPSSPQVGSGEKRSYKPTSFYLSDPQLEKLDELTLAYKKRAKKRINRNDIVRALIDEADLEELIRII